MKRFESGRLVVATHNPGKLQEIQVLLEHKGIDVVSAAAFSLAVPEETEATFAGNAALKAIAAAKATGEVCLADDSGLSVDALGGAPGVQTADWAETPNGRDFKMAMARVISELSSVNARPPFRASFHCALALAWPDGTVEVFEGVVDGEVVFPLRGAHGHGFDPIFLPDGSIETFGEMSPERKAELSHRTVAFRKLVAGCFT